MTPYAIIALISAYLALMFNVARLSRRGSDFFGSRKKTPWPLVAISMIGAVMSGVTFVSVPGMVGTSAMGYLQTCLGFMAGYVVIAFGLIPLYYRLQVLSIYQYLDRRFGVTSHRTGAWFFFISKLLGASVRLYLVCLILQMLVFDPLDLPFALNVVLCVAVLCAYTFRGGVRAVIWTDVLNAVCMVAAVILTLVFIAKALGLSLPALTDAISKSEMSRIFFFDDIRHPQFFWKQFFGGLFIVVGMTGMDQDMMQRALNCRDFRSSQKNMLLSTVLQTAVIALLLGLGVALYLYADATGIAERGDRLYPAVATSAGLPATVGLFFVLGLLTSAFGSGGSALTALTISFTVDILDKGGSDRTRKAVHIAMAAAVALTVLLFSALNSTSAIDAVFKIASYTYGPILGLFAFGMLSKRQVRDRLVPIIAIAAPAICLVLQLNSKEWFGGYTFSYEILPLNALLTMAGLWLLSRNSGGEVCQGG
jgi:Na+/proline symporter